MALLWTPAVWNAGGVHDHIELLAGNNSRGAPVTEQVPAEHLGESQYRILATPGLVWGCARSDVVRVLAGGAFEVVERGGNVTIHISETLPPSALDALRHSFRSLDGEVEEPEDRRFTVITVPVSAGFKAIEDAADDALASVNVSWAFGNVYDENDVPLNWWAQA